MVGLYIGLLLAATGVIGPYLANFSAHGRASLGSEALTRDFEDFVVDLDSREDYQYDLCWKRGKYSCLGDSRDMLVPGDLFWACSMESA